MTFESQIGEALIATVRSAASRPRNFGVRLSLLLLVCALPIQIGFAQTTGVFSRVGFGARGIGLSNALVADISGDASPYYNPALAPFTRAQHLSVSAALLRLDRELQYLQFATPLKPKAGVAIGLTHAGVTGIDGRDNSGFHTEDLSTNEYAFFVAFGLRLSERVSAGVGLQLFRSDLYFGLNPVRTVGVDFGLTAVITDDLRVGFAVEDLLARYTWNSSGAFGANGKTTSDKFPRRIRSGFSLDLLGKKARLLGEYEVMFATVEMRTQSVELVGGTPSEVITGEEIRRVSSQGRVGFEFDLIEGFAVRAGADRIGYNGLSGVSPSAGFSVRQPVGNVTLEGAYAIVIEPGAVGAMNMLTLLLFL